MAKLITLNKFWWCWPIHVYCWQKYETFYVQCRSRSKMCSLWLSQATLGYLEVYSWEILKVLKERKKYQPRILYPGKLFFYSEEELKTFSDKRKPRASSPSRPALQQMFNLCEKLGTTYRKEECWRRKKWM